MAYWFRFRLSDSGRKSASPYLYLAVTRVIVPDVDVYLPKVGGKADQYQHMAAGVDRIGSGDDLGHRIRALVLPQDIRPEAYIYAR